MNLAKIDVRDNDLVKAFQQFAGDILAQDDIQAVLVPWQPPLQSPSQSMVMPALIRDPRKLLHMDALSPAFALNAARMVARLTRKSAGGGLAVMLRPCEIRAFIELVKLNQGSLDEVLILGADCLGAFRNKDFLQFRQVQGEAATRTFYTAALKEEILTDFDLTPACKACEQPLADGADLAVLLRGVQTNDHILVCAQSDKGRAMLAKLGWKSAAMPDQRQPALDKLIQSRSAYRDRMFQETRAAVENLQKLSTYLAACVNCYNCRTACPVCYCRECVFATDVFDHEPAQYLAWARKKGVLKMPADTLFYHLTRLAHMSTACVGCGQCSNACPNDIPLVELFRTVAHCTQAAFDYRAGGQLEQKPPLAEFHEQEFEEVVGMG